MFVGQELSCSPDELIEATLMNGNPDEIFSLKMHALMDKTGHRMQIRTLSLDEHYSSVKMVSWVILLA